jgi:hypothetical protein
MDPCIVDDLVEIPIRCSFVIEFIIPKFIESSTCFERHTTLHQELELCLQPLVIYPCGDRPLFRLGGKWINFGIIISITQLHLVDISTEYGVTVTRCCSYSCFVLLKMGDSDVRNM